LDQGSVIDVCYEEWTLLLVCFFAFEWSSFLGTFYKVVSFVRSFRFDGFFLRDTCPCVRFFNVDRQIACISGLTDRYFCPVKLSGLLPPYR